MKQAETYMELIAVCPHCGARQEVEWCDESVNGKEEWVCAECSEPFSYVHPENQYGLSV